MSHTSVPFKKSHAVYFWHWNFFVRHFSFHQGKPLVFTLKNKISVSLAFGPSKEDNTPLLEDQKFFFSWKTYFLVWKTKYLCPKLQFPSRETTMLALENEIAAPKLMFQIVYFRQVNVNAFNFFLSILVLENGIPVFQGKPYCLFWTT